jgi:hypothetical protein
MLGVRCNVTSAHITNLGKCVPIIEMHWIEHGGKACDDFWVQQGKFENSLALLAQQ